jgi:hypothetical protein
MATNNRELREGGAETENIQMTSEKVKRFYGGKPQNGHTGLQMNVTSEK